MAAGRPPFREVTATVLRQREYYLANRERIIRRTTRRNRELMQTDPEFRKKGLATLAAVKAKYKLRCNRHLNPQSEVVRRHRDRDALKRDLFNAYGNACACCGERRVAFLTLDHINGDGAAHRKEILGSNRGGDSSRVWADVRRLGFPKDRFRLLCMNCNWATRFSKKCPHQEEIAAMAQASGLDTHADVANAPVSLGHAM